MDLLLYMAFPCPDLNWSCKKSRSSLKLPWLLEEVAVLSSRYARRTMPCLLQKCSFCDRFNYLSILSQLLSTLATKLGRNGILRSDHFRFECFKSNLCIQVIFQLLVTTADTQHFRAVFEWCSDKNTTVSCH